MIEASRRFYLIVIIDFFFQKKGMTLLPLPGESHKFFMRLKNRIEALENACDIKSNCTNNADKILTKCWREAFKATFIYHMTPPYFVFRERYVRAMHDNNVEITEATMRDDYDLIVKITRELDA